MPYMIASEDGKKKVYKKGDDGKPTGKALGSHDDDDSAKKQIAAIEANEGKKDYWLSQEEVSYQLPSPTTKANCGACRWFKDQTADYDGYVSSIPGCHIVVNYPLPIRATGWCDRFEEIPVYEMPKSIGEEIADALVDVLEGERELSQRKEAAIVNAQDSRSTFNLRSAVKSLLEQFGVLSPEESSVKFDTGFKVLDNDKWIAFYSNNFEDRDGEYFPEAAIDRFIARVDAKEVPLPELWFWHTPIVIGQADAIARVDHIVIAVGHFHKDKVSQKFKRHLTTKEYQEVSHGFYFPEDQYYDSAFWDFVTYEISPLPEIAVAANPFTYFGGIKEMTIDERKRSEIARALGDPELTNAAISAAEAKSKEIAARGVGSKEATPPAVDRLGALEDGVKEMTTSINALVALLTPKVDPPAAQTKETTPAQTTNVTPDAQRAQLVKEVAAEVFNALNQLTPRQATKDQATQVDANNPHFANLAEGQLQGQINSEKEQRMRHTFPWLAEGQQNSANGAGG